MKRWLVLTGLIMIFIVSTSTLVSAREDIVSLNSLECVCCDQWTVILVSTRLDYNLSETVERFAGSSQGTCYYCQKIQVLNTYKTYERFYEAIENHYECLNCGWFSQSWVERGNFLYEVYKFSHRLCSVCGGVL